MTLASEGRGGFTLVEALTALLLGWLLLALTLGTLARQRTVLQRLARRAEVVEALRTIRHVLGEELRWTPMAEVGVGADTLALRAYRGAALVCPGGSDRRSVVVGFRGVRSPDPEKDSVELTDVDGRSTALALLDRETGVASCGEAAELTAERWLLSGPAPEDAVVARVFERGSYHLTGAALRYRRGGGGRQPLTPGVLETPPSRFELRGVRVLDVRVYGRLGVGRGDSMVLALPYAR